MPRSALGAIWIAALLALWVYVRTLSPTVAWVNQGEDSGDLLSASATLGIPHPTGYPLFTLLGRVASLVPIGSVAFRINLVAALAGAASVLFLALVVLELTRPRDDDARASNAKADIGAIAAAVGAALAYAFSRGAWSQSVLAEVYTLNAAFLGATLWSLVRAERTGSVPHLALAAYLLGLGLTNHLLLLAVAPAVALVALRSAFRRVIGPAGLVLLFLLVIWGVTLDLYLPVRASQAPEFAWGAPSSPARLWWVLTGAQYATHFFGRNLGEIAHHLVPGRFGLDFGIGLLALLMGLVGVWWAKPRGMLPLLLTLLAAALLLSVYSIPDDVGYWMPVFYLICALAGVGWAGLALGRKPAAGAEEPAPARGAGVRAGVVALALSAGAYGLLANYRAVDASTDVRPWVWAHQNLQALEPDALIVSEYDGRTFALWFYKATEFRRTHPHLAVVYKYLLVWPWYQRQIAHVYPTIAVPPYPGSMDAMMNRLIARNIRKTPVYLVRRDPALLPIFETEPVGYGPDPLYRVRVAERAVPERSPGRR
jgi:hypothetical protein